MSFTVVKAMKCIEMRKSVVFSSEIATMTTPQSFFQQTFSGSKNFRDLKSKEI